MPHIAGIDHVQVAIPPGSDDAARAFYGGDSSVLEVVALLKQGIRPA
ncbi:hypothetical protein G4G28_03445 [Massilia sp. Dwa41.01b]|nr:hypothetical protein [Massilia sp. Dwa41.01b]QNA87755.1 hypothetical protein G4G28_03445 [Massilia sp. Dwa41.01b]